MNGLCSEAIALDSNVFIHLSNPEFNTNDHIGKLLRKLALDELSILVDDHGHIATEYAETVIPVISNADDIGPQTALLRYWMDPSRRLKEPVDKQGTLFKEVSKIIIERDEVEDRCFVCIAFTAFKPLVTNDHLHIIKGPTHELGGPKGSLRRARLIRVAKKLGLKNRTLCNTLEAWEQLET